MSGVKLTGALLLILSCGGLGAAKASAIRKACFNAEELLRALERLETEICVCCRSLPETLSILAEEDPYLFSGLEDTADVLRSKPFYQVWREHFLQLDLSEGSERAVVALGAELTGGADPEKAFSVCRDRLRAEETKLRQALERNGKVYVAAGLTAGCLLVIAAV